MKIIYTSKFLREYKKISEKIKISAEEKEKIFRSKIKRKKRGSKKDE